MVSRLEPKGTPKTCPYLRLYAMYQRAGTLVLCTSAKEPRHKAKGDLVHEKVSV